MQMQPTSKQKAANKQCIVFKGGKSLFRFLVILKRRNIYVRTFWVSRVFLLTLACPKSTFRVCMWWLKGTRILWSIFIKNECLYLIYFLNAYHVQYFFQVQKSFARAHTFLLDFSHFEIFLSLSQVSKKIRNKMNEGFYTI